MPFPVERKYIELMEENLEVRFPKEFKNRMMKNNGGELKSSNYYFELYPFFDTTNRKRISRTCNHIEKETESARKWFDFPTNAIAIGSDGSGNQLVLIHDEDRNLKEELFFWNHETGQIEEIAESIYDIENKN